MCWFEALDGAKDGLIAPAHQWHVAGACAGGLLCQQRLWHAQGPHKAPVVLLVNGGVAGTCARGWPELDDLGDPSLLTSPTPEPRYRIDWVLGPGWAEGDRLDVLPSTPWSDHAPLVLTHTPRGG